jgi:hypothetical protein
MSRSAFSYFIGFSVLSCLVLAGCLKDRCTHAAAYKLYTPVYTSLNEIRESVRSEAPRALEHTGKIFYHNGYLFLNELNKGVHIIDDRNPAAPENVGFINIPGNIDLTAKGNILYADNYIDLVAIDIHDPLHVKVTGRVKQIFPTRIYGYGFTDNPEGKGIITGFKVKDTVVKNDCDIQWNSGGWYYDVQYDYSIASTDSKASQPSVNPTAASVGGSMARFTTYRDYLYTVHQNMLGVYDISQPGTPDSSTTVNLQQNVETIFQYDHYLFIGSPTGMLIYDVTDPKQPSDRKNFSHFYSCDPVVAQNGYAYVTLRTGAACGQSAKNELDVVNVKNMNNIQLESMLALSNPHGLSIDGNKLMVCDGGSGIRFLDVSNPSKPEIVKTIGGVEAYDAIALNGLLIVTAKEGIFQYDYSDYNHPKLLSKISTSSTN